MRSGLNEPGNLLQPIVDLNKEYCIILSMPKSLECQGDGHEGPKLLPMVALMAKIAPRLGFKVNLEPTYGMVGQLIDPSGRKFYFRGASLDLNTLGAMEIARDKGYASHFMKALGYPVPEGQAFYPDKFCQILHSDLNRQAAIEYARTLGFPVIVKPNSRSQGEGVQKVHNEEELDSALGVVFNLDKVALVQKPVTGDDYRILVLDDTVMAAYKRSPLSILGDGRSTIVDLIVEKQKSFIKAGRDTKIKLDDDRLIIRLRRAGLNLSMIPALGQKLSLLDNANLSTGGDAEDVTSILNEGFASIATRLTADMGLRFCGVDIMTPDPIDVPPTNYTVIEINATPGVDYYAQGGTKQQQIVEGLFEKILLSLSTSPSRA